eukprot:Em0021g894a
MLSTAVTSEDKLASASAPPTQRQPTTKTEAKGGSYMQAMTADMMWEWPAEVSGDGTPYTPSAPPRPQAVQKVQGQLESQLPPKVQGQLESQLPPKVQGQLESQLPPKVQGQLESQLPPKHVGSPTVSGRKVTAGNPAPTTLIPGGIVHYGFVPHGKRDIPEATQPCELPGSRNAPGPDVITVPPQKLAPERSNSSSVSVAAKSTKAVSIEQAGRQMESYAPLLPGGVQKPMDYGEEGVFDDTPPNVFCMELSALVTGTVPVEKPAEYLAIPGVEDKRPSIMSNISLAGSMESDPFVIRTADLEDEDLGDELYSGTLKSRTCYDLIPTSTKIVVLDTNLKVKKAFFALVANEIRAAPLWESTKQGFVGMLTITDFINILRHHYKSPIAGMDELENQTIRMWRDSEQKVASLNANLIRIDPMQSLYEAAKMLVEHKIHRLPVIDSKTGNAIYILTHKRLLRFLYSEVMSTEPNQPSFVHSTLEELGIGTYANIATASPDTPIIVALNMFHEKRVSALPIVDASGKVVDIYAKYDVINLAVERTYGNLDVTLKEALQHRAQGFEGVHTCMPSESFYTILRRIVATKVHRLVVVDEQHRVKGVISLSDILKFLVLTSHT